MRAAKRRSSSNKFFVFKGLVFTFVVVSGWILLNIPTFREFLETYSKRNQEREQIQLLEQSIHELKKQQHSLKINGFEAERHVREKFGMHRPGEKVIFLKGETPAPAKRPDFKEPSPTTAPVLRKEHPPKPTPTAKPVHTPTKTP